jgi:REP element-mobilizing transposase RayT
MSEFIHKSHNVSVLLHHFVCPAKYPSVVFDKEIDTSLKEICLEISKGYIVFIEIGTDQDYVHFLIQSVPMESPTKIIRIVKSITAKEIFRIHPELSENCGAVNFGPKAIM